MALTLSLKSSHVEGAGGRKRVVKRYGVTASSSYANSGTTGDLIDFQAAGNPNNLERVAFTRVPDGFAVRNCPGGFTAKIEPGAAFTDWGIRIFQSDDAVDPLDELANGAYPAGITSQDGAAFEIELSGPSV